MSVPPDDFMKSALALLSAHPKPVTVRMAGGIAVETSPEVCGEAETRWRERTASECVSRAYEVWQAYQNRRKGWSGRTTEISTVDDPEWSREGGE